MRILWIGPWHSDVLCQQVRGSMAQALHEAGIEISTIVVGSPGSWTTGGFDYIYYCPKPRGWLGKIVNQFRFIAIASHYRGDHIVLGEKAAHFAPWLALVRRMGLRTWKLVLDIRTLPIPLSANDAQRNVQKRFWLQLKTAFRHVDAWMAITPRLRDAVMDKVNTRNLPCQIWQSAVDRSFLESGGVEPADFITKCGHAINVLYLGSLGRGRQLDLAVKAMAEPRFASGAIGLHLVGTGDHLDELRGLVARQRLERLVHIWGSIPYAGIQSVLKGCDLGILPLPPLEAWNVSSALKLFEYLGAGLPVLVSDIPAHRDVLDCKSFAFFMPEYSLAGFASTLESFSNLSLDQRHALGLQARGFVAAAHTWNHRAHDIQGFLARLDSQT